MRLSDIDPADELKISGQFGSMTATITAWRGVVAREPSAIKRAYAESIGWDFKTEAKQQMAWLRTERLKLAQKLSAQGVKVKDLRRYAAEAENPWQP